MKKERLTCCRSPENREEPSNLMKEKTGYRCADCGAFYPFLEIHHGGKSIDPKSISRPWGRRLKYKKAAQVFRGNHYYATNKKTLLRFDIDEAGEGSLTDETPIMGQAAYVTVSEDGRYIATENFSGTVAVIDARTKEVIGKRRNLSARGTFRFVEDSLVYFRNHHGIFRWDFREDRESLLWEPPRDWPAVCCHNVLEPGGGRLVYHITGGTWNFALVLKGLEPQEPVRLPASPVLSELTDAAGRYTLPVKDRVLVYDGDFRQMDEFPYPELVERSDGGGVFPIAVFLGYAPHHVHLSPDGEWVLFDFFTCLLLMERKTGELRYCVYSYTGTTTVGSGFLDDRRIWYTWADSTYIMEL